MRTTEVARPRAPVFALKERNSDPGVTNARYTALSHWRRWLGAESRCVVPFTSFSENETSPDGKTPPVRFALDENRPPPSSGTASPAVQVVTRICAALCVISGAVTLSRGVLVSR
jgi:putative SOS response-associated peptidase YedK